MDILQKDHIRKSLPELEKFTKCTNYFLGELQTNKIIQPEERKMLTSIHVDSLRANKFYEILLLRIEHYDKVKALLLEGNQKKAFAILDNCHSPDIVDLQAIAYDKNKFLGTGSFHTTVYQGIFQGKQVAVKRILLGERNMKDAVKKIMCLRKLEEGHVGILKCFATRPMEGFILLAMELCDVSLEEWVISEQSTAEIFEILKQATQAVAFVHSHGITHGGLTPRSFLITRYDENRILVKLKTFGTSMLIGDRTSKVGWAAPEIIPTEMKSSEIGLKADIFSLGCIFYYTLTRGRHPFGKEEFRRVTNIVDGKHNLDDILENDGAVLGFKWLIMHMISHNEVGRPKAEAILGHHVFWTGDKTTEFFKDIAQYVEKRSELLDVSAGLVTFGDSSVQEWLPKVCPVVQSYLKQQEDLESGNFSSLVKVMYIMETEDLPEDVKDAMYGCKKKAYFQYWLFRFPPLLPIVWTVFQNCNEGGELKKYYDNDDIFKFSLVGKLKKKTSKFAVPKSNIFQTGTKKIKSQVQEKPPSLESESKDKEDLTSQSEAASNNSAQKKAEYDEKRSDRDKIKLTGNDAVPIAKPRIINSSNDSKNLESGATNTKPKDKKDNEHLLPLTQAVIGTEKIHSKPSKSGPFSIPCTGRHCNATLERDWNCSTCLVAVQYGFDDHVYCKCGKTPVQNLKFKCPDPNHSDEYEFHDDDKLAASIYRLKPFKDVNILILGETGVGKSTWINGFVNFLKYKSLDEAEKGELFTLIPSQMTIYDSNFVGITVTTGSDPNEVFEVGHSATQETKIYEFTCDKLIVRLIDTPGIGDTRGVDQDKINFQNILSTISGLKEVHGICILLKPNQAKLSITFRFCVTELLKHLHRDASKNILFCFTNSRSTLYCPGDTLPALRVLLNQQQQSNKVVIPLNKETVFCFDSEAYRFLAAVKNNPPVLFDEDNKVDFAKSWDKSYAETNRMLRRIQAMEPHPIQSTLNLNHARELVLKMTRPLAEVCRSIQINKSIVEDDKREIENMRENIEELRKKQMTTRTEIEVRSLEHPKTVCGNSRCVRIWGPDNGIKSIEYATVCHLRCTQTKVPADTRGDIKLLNCMVFKLYNGNCRNCGHSYREHLHVYYDSIQVLKQVENLAVVESLNKDLSAAEMKQKMIDEKNRLIKEYEFELTEIEKASVTFAYFLKKNAITFYNDAMDAYLLHLIQEEQDKVNSGGNSKTLKSLVRSRESYLHERRILETQMEKGELAKPQTEDVAKLIKILQGLKHTGKILMDAINCADYAESHLFQEKVEQQPTNKYKKGLKQIFKQAVSPRSSSSFAPFS